MFLYFSFYKSNKFLTQGHKHDKENEEDKLHHDHFYLKQTRKVFLMKINGLITLSVDFLFVMAFLGMFLSFKYVSLS